VVYFFTANVIIYGIDKRLNYLKTIAKEATENVHGKCLLSLNVNGGTGEKYEKFLTRV
jgi:hypothetical protein